MINKGDFPAKRLSPLDCMCDALRRAKELALEVGVAADSRGWPCLWMKKHVLVYGPRPDGKRQTDRADPTDDAVVMPFVARA